MNEALEIAVGGLVTGCVYALVALGFTLVFSVSGVLNLSQGAFPAPVRRGARRPPLS